MELKGTELKKARQDIVVGALLGSTNLNWQRGGVRVVKSSQDVPRQICNFRGLTVQRLRAYSALRLA